MKLFSKNENKRTDNNNKYKIDYLNTSPNLSNNNSLKKEKKNLEMKKFLMINKLNININLVIYLIYIMILYLLINLPKNIYIEIIKNKKKTDFIPLVKVIVIGFRIK